MAKGILIHWTKKYTLTLPMANFGQLRFSQTFLPSAVTFKRECEYAGQIEIQDIQTKKPVQVSSYQWYIVISLLIGGSIDHDIYRKNK